MYIEKIENDKRRTVYYDREYSYKEDIKAIDSEEYIEFLSLTKGNDYVFAYFNGTFEEKIGVFTVEHDSQFIEPFLNLINDDDNLKIEDDFSDGRFIEFSKNENGDVIISVHLLPGECDGSITLKNIMHDLRSYADVSGTNIKERLSIFFDELVGLIPKLGGDQRSLTKKDN